MEKITFADIEQSDGKIVAMAFITQDNGSFTSMPKAIYDAQQAQQAHLTESFDPSAK